ncbi:carboxyl transferase domain-containing protein [Candidatus Poriferisodalis sp.]|uniref:carboxyl transferase domain-containing protein n=1 Tax=Candidatus Poriferisodalis sp. TaxID=3101277 RepID=UPI003B02A0C6
MAYPAMICGQSFGGSSFLSALSDYVMTVRGSCLAVTSSKVFGIATGEVISFEDVGGVDVRSRRTGQIRRGRRHRRGELCSHSDAGRDADGGECA